MKSKKHQLQNEAIWNIIFEADLDTPAIGVSGENLKKINDHTISVDGVEIDVFGKIIGIFTHEEAPNLEEFFKPISAL